jgi:murein DD-endopeptidase MepM/ murein hydrolase activator NlpD
VGSRVEVGHVPVPVRPDGTFVAALDRFAPERVMVKVCVASTCDEHVWKVAERIYKTQSVKGVPPATVNPNPADLRRIDADNAAIKKARSAVSGLEGFLEEFRLPVNGPTSGVYGSRRLYNGEERSWHRGHDLAAPTGTPVYAPASGKVVLARDTFMNGNLVIVDHGQGVFTLYAHLDSMAVKVGSPVLAGDKLGEVGTTGRSTGPHLHWGLNVGNVPLDPWLLIGDNGKNNLTTATKE